MLEQLFSRGHAGAFTGLEPTQPRDLMEFSRFTEMARGTYDHDRFNETKEKILGRLQQQAKPKL